MTSILFIDDDAITLKMLCKIAEMQGYATMTASSGTEAVQRGKDNPPDIILLDMMLADMDGFAVLEMLRSQPQTAQIPVVFLSAGFELDAEDRALAAGAKAYLTKPISIERLKEIVDEHAGS
jgi:CheY-like chemotaxis protein